MIGRKTRATIIAIVYLPLLLLGGYAVWKAAPDAESALFPPVVDMRYIPFDPDHPEVTFSQQLDRTCWRMSFHKLRNLVPLRKTVTWIAHDGTRYYSEPVNAVTGYSLNSLDTKPAGFTGSIPVCSIMPDNFDASLGYTIEIYAQFDPPHHLWSIEEFFPAIHIPAIVESAGAIE